MSPDVVDCANMFCATKIEMANIITAMQPAKNSFFIWLPPVALGSVW
jgi:hypothetical protein